MCLRPPQYFDSDGDGSMSYDEFLVGVRGELNERRKALVDLVTPSHTYPPFAVCCRGPSHSPPCFLPFLDCTVLLL